MDEIEKEWLEKTWPALREFENASKSMGLPWHWECVVGSELFGAKGNGRFGLARRESHYRRPLKETEVNKRTGTGL